MDKHALGCVLQVLGASINFPHEVAFALDKVVEQRCASLFLVQFTIEGVPTMLSLEASSDFVTTGSGINIREKNES